MFFLLIVALVLFVSTSILCLYELHIDARRFFYIAKQLELPETERNEEHESEGVELERSHLGKDFHAGHTCCRILVAAYDRGELQTFSAEDVFDEARRLAR